MSSAVTTSDRQNDIIDRFFRESHSPQQPGMAVGIYRGGRSVFLQGYGTADLEHDVRITPQTVFHIASVSKQFTAFAIALLARERKVDLDADIRTYLPYLEHLGHPITVNHLIHNISGLRDQWALFTLGGQEMDSRLRQRQIINMVSRQRALNFAPGSEFMYSNTNFTLLAEIVHAVSGRTLRQFTTEHIFQPLGMAHTFFYDDVTEVVPGRAHSYRKTATSASWQRALLNYDNSGATSLLATVTDFARWAGNFAHPTVGDAALIEQVCSTSGRLRDGAPFNYGFGLWRRRYAGHEAVEHSGGDAGFRSWFAFFPQEDFGLALFANYPVEDFPKLIHAIVDVYLNDTKAQFKDYSPAAITADDRLLEELAGAYVGDFAPLTVLERTAQGLTFKRAGLVPQPVVFRVDGTFDVGANSVPQICYRVQRDGSGLPVGFEEAFTSLGGAGRVSILYRRIEPLRLSPGQLAEFAGDYRSEELDITYRFTVEEGRLTARSLWSWKPATLTPTLKDRFDNTEEGVMSIVTFMRDTAGKLVGLQVHGGRVRSVEFVRIDSGQAQAS